jgi:hypothetical protein
MDEAFNGNVWAQREVEIFEAAQNIISQRQEKISFMQTPGPATG